MNLKTSNTDPKSLQSKHQSINASKKGVGGIGEAIRSAAPWPCARRERRGRSVLLFRLSQLKDLFLTTTTPAAGLASFSPHSAPPICFFRHQFPTSFLKSFWSHFEGRFGAPNRLKWLQAVIQNRPSKFVCPIFGFGSLFVNSRPP